MNVERYVCDKEENRKKQLHRKDGPHENIISDIDIKFLFLCVFREVPILHRICDICHMLVGLSMTNFILGPNMSDVVSLLCKHNLNHANMVVPRHPISQYQLRHREKDRLGRREQLQNG